MRSAQKIFNAKFRLSKRNFVYCAIFFANLPALKFF
jgi:hypothetical protein